MKAYFDGFYGLVAVEITAKTDQNFLAIVTRTKKAYKRGDAIECPFSRFVSRDTRISSGHIIVRPVSPSDVHVPVVAN